MKKQSFITGAVILMAANAVSKILGAVLKIPLAYILNEEGMAVYNIAFEVYIMFLSFIISGLPFAVSKLSAEAASLNKWQRGRQIVSVSTRLLVITGAAGSALLYFAAPFFAVAMKETKAVFAIRMISPSVFFVALGMGYRSYFQGVSRMVPVAISQVSESFVKLAAGYGFAVLFLNFGAEKTAGGAVLGVTAGEITQAAILAFAYIFSKK
ncbi:MAG: oligosaccharide flippase family protein, partial [Clostridia bacterium]|nr:oligosaccharide flippase family protein [Clostridia bacterium]